MTSDKITVTVKWVRDDAEETLISYSHRLVPGDKFSEVLKACPEELELQVSEWRDGTEQDVIYSPHMRLVGEP